MRSLDFQPLNPPPRVLPTCIWNGVTLWTGASADSPLDLSAEPFHHAFHSIFGKMSFIELAEVADSAEDLKIDRENLFGMYNFRYDAKLEKTLQTYKALPPQFHAWAREHAISPADIYPLCALKNSEALHPALEKFETLELSRSQGAQLIELLAECALMDTQAETLTENSGSFAEWLKHLQGLRYPRTLHRDGERQEKLLKGWPKPFNARWVRQGDRSGVEARFFVGSKKELAEKIAALTRVHDGMSDDGH